MEASPAVDVMEAAAATTATTSSSKSSNAKIAQQIADRRLVEYFVIVSSIETTKPPPPATDTDDNNSKGNDGAKLTSPSKKPSQPSNGDISFSDWKTESSYEHDDEEDSIYAAYQFKPTITARYPLHNHPDNPLDDNVTFFCHPSGGIQLRTEEYMPKVSHLF